MIAGNFAPVLSRSREPTIAINDCLNQKNIQTTHIFVYFDELCAPQGPGGTPRLGIKPSENSPRPAPATRSHKKQQTYAALASTRSRSSLSRAAPTPMPPAAPLPRICRRLPHPVSIPAGRTGRTVSCRLGRTLHCDPDQQRRRIRPDTPMQMGGRVPIFVAALGFSLALLLHPKP